jgi:hypothetical protein
MKIGVMLILVKNLMKEEVRRTFLKEHSYSFIFDLNDSEKLNACAVLYKDMWCCRCSSVCV